LARIKECLYPITIIRNCVAHARFITDDEIENYDIAKNKLNTAIEGFWKGIKETVPTMVELNEVDQKAKKILESWTVKEVKPE